MKISNFSLKPFFQILFFVSVGVAVVNVLLVFTNLRIFGDTTHLILSGVFALIAFASFLQNVFIKYDSSDELIEIERASLFTPKNKVKSAQQGYVKRQIKNYKIRSFLFFKSIEITYVKSNGDEDRYIIPVTLFGSDNLKKIVGDLREILNNNSQMFIGSSFRNPYTK
jgi:hypothetical protein